MRGLDGRVALVTGAGSGIGRASAVALGRCGSTVAIADSSSEGAAETAAIMRAEGLAGEPFGADVSDEQQVGTLLREVVERFGAVDVLHANAGILRLGSAETLSVDDWDATIDVNVRGVFLCARAAIPGMLERGGGSIVVTASTAGLVGEDDHLAYCTSKGAIISLARQLAIQYARRGIRVNAVCPGWIDTGFADPAVAGLSGDQIDELIDRGIPAGRLGTADDVAAAVVFLASDDAAYVTGHALVVDGGMTAI